MCLAIPGKVIKIKNSKATVEQKDHQHKVDFSLVPDLKINDWVICNQDMVVAKLTEEEAQEKLNILQSNK